MAQGINKRVTIAKESAWGTKASNSSAARNYRRVTASFQGEKDTFGAAEIRTDQQMVDSRHGTRRASGSLSGELCGSSYDEIMAAAVRRDFGTGATTGAITVVAASSGKFTRSAGSFVSDGFKVGRVFNVTGYNDSGNNGLFYATSVTTTELFASPLAGQTMSSEAEGDTVTILERGKVTYTPSTGHTDDTFSVEEFYDDEDISRIFLGQQVNNFSLSLSPDAMATVSVDFLGKDFEAAGSSEFFTSATGITSEGTYSGSAGKCFVNGVQTGIVTSLNVSIANNITQEKVLFSETMGAKSRGKVMVTYDATLIFDADDFLNYFRNEEEISVGYVLVSSDKTEAFVVYLPRCKVNSATTDDGEKVVILSVSGEALKYVGGSNVIQSTTIQLQDTTL
jgi:hypothetical protein